MSKIVDLNKIFQFTRKKLHSLLWNKRTATVSCFKQSETTTKLMYSVVSFCEVTNGWRVAWALFQWKPLLHLAWWSSSFQKNQKQQQLLQF
jgi:hypothetical protein